MCRPLSPEQGVPFAIIDKLLFDSTGIGGVEGEQIIVKHACEQTDIARTIA